MGASTIPASQVLVVVATAPIRHRRWRVYLTANASPSERVVGSLIAVGGVIGLIL